MRIEGEKSGNAEVFSEVEGDVSTRAPTQAHVIWKTQGWEQWSRDFPERTPDLTQFLNELISEDDWNPGNAFLFIFTREYTGNPNKTSSKVPAGRPGCSWSYISMMSSFVFPRSPCFQHRAWTKRRYY